MFKVTGGSNTLPQTIVLNRKGEVIYNEIRSVNHEMLEKLYEQASEGRTAGEAEEAAATETAPEDETKRNEAVSEAADADIKKDDDMDSTQDSDAPYGHDIGDCLPDFTIECLDGSTFTLSDHKGKIVVIHLWATYSKDSVEGLKELDELCREQGDAVVSVAIHNHYSSGKAAEYAKDIKVPVAVDNGDEEIFKLTGGSMMLPRTVILNERGEVIYNAKGVLTKDRLEYLLVEN